ncbi:hypothetical protein RJ640_030337, partial [Escallonia rubra]
MAKPDESSIQVPILEPDDSQIDLSLRRLERFLGLFGFCQTSIPSAVISWLAFASIGVVLPVILIVYSYCSDCEKYQIRVFELEILVSQAIVGAISLLCISHNIRKYGLRKLLFVDQCHGHMVQFRGQYIEKIHVFYRTLVTWVIFCFLLKASREVTRAVYLHHDSWWLSIATTLASLVCWTYSTIVFLSGTALFNLVGNLLVIHFENYGKFLEKDLDVSVYIEEHMRLTYYLSKVSHRFRVFALLEFLVISASQFAALLQTTGNKGIINFINAGDFAVSSIVQLVGLVLCLIAAAKISHRAQSLGAIASRWHAFATCNSSDASQSGVSNSGGNLEAGNPVGSIPLSYSESDLESTDYFPLSTNTQVTSYTTSYHKRQAFVTYVQSNTGGFTIFGWMVDRHLINTIFFIELSLVFF